ncbi:non-ribosomal peptide synthetase/MFS transporter [Nonomuraea sediminis]|uniref:non-ribosomal peptide synthetase/MFS transporter n=1 Tax=Nonomuraea sediminis TaxID=2835864 RepID=UPI001BDC8653|nr:non-ribosomal peptide synthetase/MFS transporter [Nonomuraea sediminis]
MTETLSEAKRALLARRLRGRGGRTIEPRGEGVHPPLSHAQERLWFLEEYAPGSTAYTVPVTVRLSGTIDEDALSGALSALVARHEALRMRFPTTDDGRPELAFGDGHRLRVAEAGDLDAAMRLVAEELATPFDLAGGPLLRALLVRLGPGDQVLLLAAHHIVADGWSCDILLRDLLALHDGLSLEPLPIGFGDYAIWESGRDYGRELDYWSARLAGLPPLDLPTDVPRPAVRGEGGHGVAVRVDAGTVAALSRLDGTLYMTLLAAFQVLLGRLSGQEDFAVGTPVAGRGLPELDGVVGMFVNTLVMRADLSGDPTFTEFLARTREAALDAYAYQELPFERLVGHLNVPRDVSRTPLTQAVFALQNYADGGDGRVTHLAAPAATSRTDLAMYLFETGDGLTGWLTYSTELFHDDTAHRLVARFGTLLRSIAADPEARLSELDLLAPGELELIDSFGRSPEPAPLDARLLHEILTQQATRTPDTVAVACGDDELTYAELDTRAGRLAAALRARGVGPDVAVGVLLEQSVDVAVALLGVLMAGGAYVPLDPKQPHERLTYMLTDSGAAAVVSTPELWPGCVEVDAPEAGLDDPGVTPGHLAYVIYTSGTTGRPKGVAVQHRQVLNYLAGVRERFAVEPGSRFTLMQSLSFDFGITVFYLSMLTGGTLRLVDPQATAEELPEADYMKMTPSHLASLLSGADPAEVLPRKLLILGGEASRSSWAVELAEHTTVVNHYGPTEATVGITTHHVTGQETEPALPIGRPLPGARVLVLDPRLRPAPIGAVGEIYLGGDRLAREYLGRPDLTAEKFLLVDGERFYRTGDLGRWLPDGELSFLGRRDLQVKVRGYRVELGEIEAALSALPEVGQAVVELRGDRLVGYLVGERLSVSELRARLGQTLPDYMIPVRYVWLDELPLKSHGKVDRGRLPEPDEERPDQAAGYVEPEGPIEAAIAEVWAGVLGVSRVGALDDFFDLGGHSLLAAQVVARLRKRLPRPVSILDLFKNPTLRGLALLAGTADDGPRQLVHRLTPDRPVRASVVCVPYGGGSAAIYQPLADAMPADTALYAVSVPGHELGLPERAAPVGEIAERCVAEILAGVPGPLVLYGHCGLGVMLSVEVARRLEAAGREVEAVYLGGIFPFARPKRGLRRLTEAMERLQGDRHWANSLRAAGLDVDELGEEELQLVVENRRRGTKEAEEYFTRLFEEGAERLRAPVIAVAGERDPATEFYQERFREWHCVASTTALVVLDEAGHFYLKYRADELAEIVTRAHPAVAAQESLDQSTWWLHDVSRGEPRTSGPEPSMRRFSAVAAGQLVSIIGSALTEFAIPIWIYTTTGSLVRFALFSVLALLPGMLVAPLAGAIVDRFDRRRVMLAGDAAAGATQLALGLLLWTGNLQLWHIYPLLVVLSVALTFQRLAYGSAIPQLVPKRYLGHANGVVQMITGTSQLVVPLVAVGLMALIGLEGILVIDVVSYTVAVLTVLLVRFPRAMAWRRRETLVAEMVGGWRYTWGSGGFRAMLVFFAVLNVFLSPLFLLLTPLVLGFGSLQDVGRVAFAGGLGVFLAGLLLTAWGGPRNRRMRGVLLSTLALAGACLVTGLRPDLLVIGIGAFAMSFGLTMVNGIYATIIQVKVPQRFHGRVIALNTLIAWSTLPIGFGLIAPYGGAVFEPLVARGGPLAGTVGALIGTGPGRGIALMYLLFAVAIAAVALVATRVRALARFDADVPDALPDDLVGLQAVSARATSAAARQDRPRPAARSVR